LYDELTDTSMAVQGLPSLRKPMVMAADIHWFCWRIPQFQQSLFEICQWSRIAFLYFAPNGNCCDWLFYSRVGMGNFSKISIFGNVFSHNNNGNVWIFDKTCKFAALSIRHERVIFPSLFLQSNLTPGIFRNSGRIMFYLPLSKRSLYLKYKFMEVYRWPSPQKISDLISRCFSVCFFCQLIDLKQIYVQY